MIELILNQLQELADADLYALSEVVDLELQRRDDVVDETADSARRRAIERERSYRRCNGSMAPPLREIRLVKPQRRRAA